MEMPGGLVLFVCERIPRIQGWRFPVRDEILACQYKKGNTYDSFAVNAAIAACYNIIISLHWLPYLLYFDGTSCDSGPSEHGKTICGDDKDALQYLNKFSWVMASTRR